MADLPPVNQRSAIASLFGSTALPAGAHAGLVFERYGRFWDPPGRTVQKPVELALRTFVNEYNKHVAAGGELLDRIRARQRAAPAGADIEERTVRTEARLAIGLGADHPLENGLTFDRVAGVPYLPATSLKGLCRAASQFLDEGGAEERLRWLGSEDSWRHQPSDRRQRGAVCFLDAYPVEPPTLDVDVLTPHYKRYYDAIARNRVDRESSDASARKQGSEGPVDWDSPNPVPFLTVSAGARFLVRLLCDASEADKRRRAFEWTWKHLLNGLDLLGLGARTAVGYGLMTPIASPTR